MRIGHFLSHYPAPGSTTRGVKELAAGLARLGHEVVIYGCGLPAGGEKQGETPGLRVVHYPAPRGLPHFICRGLRERFAENRDQLDLLVVHGLFNPAAALVAWSARRAGVPYVVCPRGLHHPALLGRRSMRKALYGRLFERPMLNGAVAIQVFDEYQTACLREYGIRTPTFVVHSGLDDEELARLTPRPRPPGDGLHLLYLGRIDAHTKGLDLLLRALAAGRAAGKTPEGLEVSLVGPDQRGETPKLLRMAKDLRLGGLVRFRGPVEPALRWETIKSADLLLCPSRHDAFPRVVLEAMAVGTPVIVSTNTGITSAVKAAGCGYVVAPDAASLWAGLEAALRERRRWPVLGEAGRCYAYAHFTWDRAAEEAARSYEEIVHTARPVALQNPLPIV